MCTFSEVPAWLCNNPYGLAEYSVTYCLVTHCLLAFLTSRPYLSEQQQHNFILASRPPKVSALNTVYVISLFSPGNLRQCLFSVIELSMKDLNQRCM